MQQRHPIYSAWNKHRNTGSQQKLYYAACNINIVPNLGVELLTNRTFTTWTADNPDGWTIIGEVGHDPEATERDPGQAHADTKTVGGSATTYYADNYYQATGPRIGLVGGTWAYGSVAGLLSWALSAASSDVGVHFTARLMRKVA